MVTHYEKLEVWQKAMDMVDGIYDLTAKFPSDEKYGLTSQLRRSAVSVPSNIAEGASRDSTKDFLRFLSITLGSLAEVETQLRISTRQGFATEIDLQRIADKTQEIGRMTRGLQKSLQTKLATNHQPPATHYA